MKAKKLLALVLSVLLIVSGMPVVLADEAPAATETAENETYADVATSGKCGDNVTWKLSGSKLTISGTGEMFDYASQTALNGPADVYSPWSYSDITTIEIKSGVTSIGSAAFENMYNLQSVVIPSSVKRIGREAFYGCTALTSLTIPKLVSHIGLWAFDNTPWLETQKAAQGDFVLFGDGVLYTYQGQGTNVTLPSSVKSISDQAFSRNSKIVSVTMPSGVKEIGMEAFWECSALRSVVLPDSITSIDSGAFSGCTSLQSVTIPKNVTSISAQTFYGCSSLKSITIPNGVKRIEQGAFEDCTSLKTVTIPESVTSVEGRAFSGTPWQKAKGDFVIQNGVLWEYQGEEQSITIPAAVKSILDYAFAKNRSVTSVTIPKTLKKNRRNGVLRKLGTDREDLRRR